MSRPGSWLRASRSVRSTRTAPRPGTCLRARLYVARIEDARREGQCRSLVEIGNRLRGHQIRSYVLQPYQFGEGSCAPVRNRTRLRATCSTGALDPFIGSLTGPEGTPASAGEPVCRYRLTRNHRPPNAKRLPGLNREGVFSIGARATGSAKGLRENCVSVGLRFRIGYRFEP